MLALHQSLLKQLTNSSISSRTLILKLMLICLILFLTSFIIKHALVSLKASL